MIWILEIISLVLGIILFRIEVLKLSCKNFIPAMFLLLYVPLFCITPILYHFLTNGAISIDHKVEGLVFTDLRIYAIYHLYNISLLICFFVASVFFNEYKDPKQTFTLITTLQQRIIFFFFYSPEYTYMCIQQVSRYLNC